MRNYFAQAWPWLGTFMFNSYVRGAVTGIGLITALAGFRDLVGAFIGRRAAAEAPTGPPPPPIDAPRP